MLFYGSLERTYLNIVVYPFTQVYSFFFLNNVGFFLILQVIKLSIQNGLLSEYTEMVLLETYLDKVDATQKVGPIQHDSSMTIHFPF